jgi:hypothetical protein
MRKPITREEFARHERMIREALRLSSTHDPDIMNRLAILERQVERLGAPQYRVIRNGIYARRVRKSK